MKRLNLLLLFTVALMFLAQPCFSQHEIFVSAGVQESWIRGTDVTWSDPLLGGQAGVGMRILNLNEQISLRGELNLSMEGSKWDNDEVSGHTNMLYLNLPLVLRYMFNSGLFAELGVQPGYLLSATDHTEGENRDVKKFLKDFNFSIPIGIGYEFKNNIGVGLRFMREISNMDANLSDDKDHSSILALRVTYTFNKNKK